MSKYIIKYKKRFGIILIGLIISSGIIFWTTPKSNLSDIKGYEEPLGGITRVAIGTQTKWLTDLIPSASYTVNLGSATLPINNYFGVGASFSGNLNWLGELKPDGVLCSNGQILKKTGANDWDCAASVSSNSIDWDEIVNSMTLDANTTVASAGFTLGFSATNIGIGTNTPTELLHIVTTRADNAVVIDHNGSGPNSTSTGGALLVENTGNTGAGVVVYSNIGATAGGRLGVFRADNVAFDQQVLYVSQDGTNGGFFTECTLATTNISECGNIASNKADFTAFGVSGYETGKGTVKITHHNVGGGDGSASILSLLASGSASATQGIFLDSSLAKTTGKLLNLRNLGLEELTLEADGDLGLLDSSPDARFEIVGSASLPYLYISSAGGADGNIFAVHNNGSASLSLNFENKGYASASFFQGSAFTAVPGAECSDAGDTLNWANGVFTCGTDATGAGGVSSNSLDFDEFVASMSLDTNTSIASGSKTFNWGAVNFNAVGKIFAKFIQLTKTLLIPFGIGGNQDGAGTTSGSIAVDTASGTFNFGDGTRENVVDARKCISQTLAFSDLVNKNQWTILTPDNPFTITSFQYTASGSNAFGFNLLTGSTTVPVTNVFTANKSASGSGIVKTTTFANAVVGDGGKLDFVVSSTSAVLDSVYYRLCGRLDP